MTAVFPGFVAPRHRVVLPDLVSGDGVFVMDTQEKRYFNAFSGLSLLFGLNHPDIENAITSQLRTLPYAHLSRARSAIADKAADSLISLFPDSHEMTTVTFSVTGAEAVEGAAKVARLYQNQRNKTARTHILSFPDSYHGSSLATTAMSGMLRSVPAAAKRGESARILECAKKDQVCSGLQDGRCSDICTAAIVDRITVEADTIAAVLIEPIVGAGGVYSRGVPFHTAIEAVCRKHDILVIVDEAATGFCRTGPMRAAQIFDLRGDIVVFSKALNGGFLPASALVWNRKIATTIIEADLVLHHGASQAGNLSCLAPIPTVIEILRRDNFSDRVTHAGDQLRAAIGTIKNVGLLKAVRQFGLMVMVEIDEGAARLSELNAACLEEGIIAYVRGNRIGLFPPITISDDEIGLLAQALDRALDRIKEN